jgi:excisionase family DNA binding protein
MKRAKDLTVQQAAFRLGVTLKYVRDLLYEGKLPGATKARRRWTIPAAAVDARLRQREGAHQR